jgi:hypothetical protein
MKLRVLWGISLLWALLFGYLASESFQGAWQAEGSVFNLGEKLQGLLAAVGAITIAALLPYGTLRVHRFHQRRQRGRLEKELTRIERKIERIDSKQEGNGAAEVV